MLAHHAKYSRVRRERYWNIRNLASQQDHVVALLTHWVSGESLNSNRNFNILGQVNTPENAVYKMASILSRCQYADISALGLHSCVLLFVFSLRVSRVLT